MSNIIKMPDRDAAAEIGKLYGQSIESAKSALETLAIAINASAARANDSLVEMAGGLAMAKQACAIAEISFKSWIEEKLTISVNWAYTLARCGEAEDVAKAVVDLRSGTKERMKRTRKLSSRDDTPETYVTPEIDEEDQEEVRVEGHLPNSTRIRGLMQRAREAIEMAEADNMRGVPVSEAVVAMVYEAATAWVNLGKSLTTSEDDNG